jgi:hypothetical protein
VSYIYCRWWRGRTGGLWGIVQCKYGSLWIPAFFAHSPLFRNFYAVQPLLVFDTVTSYPVLLVRLPCCGTLFVCSVANSCFACPQPFFSILVLYGIRDNCYVLQSSIGIILCESTIIQPSRDQVISSLLTVFLLSYAHLTKVSTGFPATSWAHLYLMRWVCCQSTLVYHHLYLIRWDMLVPSSEQVVV